MLIYIFNEAKFGETETEKEKNLKIMSGSTAK